MRRMLLAGLVLLAGLELVLYRQYREQRDAVDHALEARLLGLAATAAKWTAGRPATEIEPLLGELVRANQLEDAYLVDGAFRVRAGVQTPAGERLNLLRLDVPRAERALDGEASAGPAYSVDGSPILAAYARAGDELLGLEAGGSFRALAEGLRRSWLASAALAALLAALFAGGLAAAGRALERARQATARSERLADLGQLAALVAHEVRNPLGILRGQIELLGERLGPDAAPRERERIAEMLEEIDRLAAVSDELLTLGRDAGVREVVAVAPLLEGVARRVARVKPRAEVVVSAPPELTVVGDPVKLGQALFNLALNAAQIGGDVVRIRVAAASAGDEVTLTVADDGPGVPPALRARLFEPFVSGRQDGRGLGLSMARQVAERHGGRLELEPTPHGERGAVFSMRLPRAGGEAWRGS